MQSVQEPNRRPPDRGTRRHRAKLGKSQGMAACHGRRPPAFQPSGPKLRRSTLVRPRSTGSWFNVFVFAWPKRNSRLTVADHACAGPSLRFQHSSGRNAGFNRDRLTMFFGLLAAASQFGTFAGSLAGAAVRLFIALLTPRRMSSAATNCLSFLASGGTKACEPPFSPSPFFK